MSEFVPVCLVDGFGNTKTLAAKLVKNELPLMLQFPHQGVKAGGPQVLVSFDRCTGETDSAGRQVYRMRGSGTPPLRERLTKAGTP